MGSSFVLLHFLLSFKEREEVLMSITDLSYKSIQLLRKPNVFHISWSGAVCMSKSVCTLKVCSNQLPVLQFQKVWR